MTLRDNWFSSAGRNSSNGGFPDELYRQRSVQVAISGILGALYAAMVIVFAFFAFGPAQVRIADCLMPLALVFGYPGAIGLCIGCIVGNYYGLTTGLSYPIDVIAGPIANLVGAILGYRIYKFFVERGKKGLAWIQISILAENITVSLVVGSYMPIYISLADTYVISAVLWYIGLFIGSLISMNVVGYLVYKMTYAGVL